MKLFKQAHVLTPESIGIKDVLVSGSRIVAIDDNIDIKATHGLEVVDCTGKYLVPGFVDSLVHISGGGGEGGFTTRTPQMPFADAVKGGVTSLIGVLGTDAITRSLEDLLAKAKALKSNGLSVYCHTGNYHYPVVTITGSVEKDIMLIDEFIGVGEIAIADHRGSQLSWQELARIAAQARVGGMLAGKGGKVSIHVGDGKDGLNILHQVAKYSDIALAQFYPTHINRTESVLKQGFALAKAGGFIDFTTSTTEQILADGEVAAPLALKQALDHGVAVGQITMSSDGNASLPVFDKQGKLIDLQIGQVTSLHQAFVDAVKEHDVEISSALKTITLNPARILGLAHKGQLAKGCDADIAILDCKTLAVEQVYAMGQCLMNGEDDIKPTYFNV
ncbi:beta-aspartyl-peptidase [Thalassotalea ponticola]|uniref:beta-aspartyl-peptidase n=1 Tax=Thalassotalea ponticola TaxID=1523392 RepID=UPI0025B4F969|nr:beta-aspartyl-peptidase [Thalassotalea ponticola]MDN3651605.1 beta-aspartyl-peptidase [Thalassotalea ponticola]